MHGANIVSIIFRLINCAALIGLGFYLFKQYMLQTIKLHISKKNQKLADLALQNQLLKEQAKSMDFAIAEQQALSRGLLQKIELWRTLVAHYITQRNEEKKRYELALANKAHKQKLFIELKDLEKRALLPALEKAANIVEDRYASTAAGQSFIAAIVHNLEKNTV